MERAIDVAILLLLLTLLAVFSSTVDAFDDSPQNRPTRGAVVGFFVDLRRGYMQRIC